MLGLRGVRLGLLTPGLFALQVRALGEAASEQIAAGKDPQVEIMVPLVGSVMELHLVRDETEQILADVAAEKGVMLTIPIGTMIELPRAALTAHRIADAADFFSFGTNDLTQTTWGFSRDDVESTVFAAYLDKGVFTVSPFETIDADGVGRLVQIAAEEGRKTKPGIKLGACGEHGGDPESIHFFHKTGLDYVSCSPFRLPVARLEAGRAAVGSMIHQSNWLPPRIVKVPLTLRAVGPQQVWYWMGDINPRRSCVGVGCGRSPGSRPPQASAAGRSRHANRLRSATSRSKPLRALARVGRGSFGKPVAESRADAP